MGDSNRVMSPWSQQSKNQKNPTAEGTEFKNVNDTTFVQLKQYETQRRLAYSSKLDSMSLYWKSYRDLLLAALQETGRAQRIVLGTCRAHQVYADAMKAMHEDVFLDEKGNVANEKQHKKLATVRKRTVKDDIASSAMKKASVLKGVQEAQQVVAEKFGENANNMDEEIAEAIGSMYEEAKNQFSNMETLGASILSELEKTEGEVTAAWGKYQPAASAGSPAMSSLPNSPQEAAPSVEKIDPWIVETQYRVAVAYQNAAWENGSIQLNELFGKVKQEEILRRMNLREFLVAFVQRQQRLFSSLPGIQNSVLEELVGKKLSHEEVGKDVQSIIESRTAKYQKQTLGTSTSSVGELQLESPLTSDLLSKAKVVERKGVSGGVSGIGNSTEWTVSLAIMTSDAYLHFFDSVDSRVSANSSPEKAFGVLMPNVVVPTSENVSLGNSNFSKGWSESLTPTESMVLAKCTVQTLDDSSFVLNEKGGGKTTASKMFGKLVDKKVQVRTQSKKEMEDWLAILVS